MTHMAHQKTLMEHISCMRALNVRQTKITQTKPLFCLLCQLTGGACKRVTPQFDKLAIKYRRLQNIVRCIVLKNMMLCSVLFGKTTKS